MKAFLLFGFALISFTLSTFFLISAYSKNRHNSSYWGNKNYEKGEWLQPNNKNLIKAGEIYTYAGKVTKIDFDTAKSEYKLFITNRNVSQGFDFNIPQLTNKDSVTIFSKPSGLDSGITQVKNNYNLKKRILDASYINLDIWQFSENSRVQSITLSE